jgi:small-conductance mechanosensitive channel
MNEYLSKLSSSSFFPHIVSILIFIFYLLLVKISYKLLSKLQLRLLKRSGTRKLTGIKIGGYQLLDKNMQFYLYSLGIRALKIVVFTVIIIFTLPLLFYLNPPTKIITLKIIGLILLPLTKIASGIVEYLPNLFTIIVIVLTIRYSLRFMKYLTGEVEDLKLKIPGFYPEWASPTYNLLKIFLYLLGLVVISPYLPGAGSAAFKGITIFAGFLISLGSSSYVGNMVAGFILTYMRSFQKGDRIMVDNTVGDVLERSLLVTRLKTPKNERITIPNSKILSGSIINYTYSASQYKVIVHTTITIGYDVDWRVVHRLLIASALAVEEVLDTPEPFVLQKSLDDFYVSYEINAYITVEKKMQRILSVLHGNILDNFHSEGVEIMSPHYRGFRREEESAIPKVKLDRDNIKGRE